MGRYVEDTYKRLDGRMPVTTNVKVADEETHPKQERYLDSDGKGDFIDECTREFTPEEFRGAMKFTIGKYIKRLGKKDEIFKEVTKIADYSNRWLEYEKKIHEEP